MFDRNCEKVRQKTKNNSAKYSKMKKLVELKHSVGQEKLAHAMEDNSNNKLPYVSNLADKLDLPAQRSNMDENPQDPFEANASLLAQDV